MSASPHSDTINKDNIRSALFDELIIRGHTLYSKDVIGIDFGGGFFSWIGVPCNKIDNSTVEILINIGIHSVNIEKMWIKLRNSSAIKYSRRVASYSVPIDLLVESLKIDHNFNADNYKSKSKEFADLIVSYGNEFSRSISSYDDLLPYLKGRVPMLGAYPERYACCLYFLGRLAEAKDFVAMIDKEKPAYFGDFANNFARL